MVASADSATRLLQEIAAAEDARLVDLARHARRTGTPSFRGRCLEPDYLAAVAAGDWTPDDEALLDRLLQRAAAQALPRVPWRHRRRLRAALHSTALSVLTAGLTSPAWQRRRVDLASAWEQSIGRTPGAVPGTAGPSTA